MSELQIQPQAEKTKTVTIYVNGRPKQVDKTELTFDQIVALAFSPVPQGAMFTVTYSKAEGNKEGSLFPGDSIKVKEGMIFNVTETSQS